MRVLHLNTFDYAGGAARASYWLHSGLQAAGIDSMMVVQHKTTGESSVHIKPGRLETILRDIRWIIDGLPLLPYSGRDVTHWSTGLIPTQLTNFVKNHKPDIIHLHWVCRGFLSIHDIGRLCSLGPPVVWTLHDSWPFTGGCHVPGTCQNYTDQCGTCPQLGSSKNRDLSSRTLARKAKKWNNSHLVLVSPSNWLARCIKDSSLFSKNRVLTIHNGLNSDQFTPVDKRLARSILHIPDTPKIKILCGGINSLNDPNKGIHLLHQALDTLARDGWKNKLELIIFGESKPATNAALPVETHYLGVLHDDATLRLAYSAADLFVLPSIQENLPNSIIESLACNTPVVAFGAGGIPEMIEHGHNGYLATPFDTDDLAHCIQRALDDSLTAHLAPCFTQHYAVSQYQSLYHELMGTDERDA